MEIEVRVFEKLETNIGTENARDIERGRGGGGEGYNVSDVKFVYYNL